MASWQPAHICNHLQCLCNHVTGILNVFFPLGNQYLFPGLAKTPISGIDLLNYLCLHLTIVVMYCKKAHKIQHGQPILTSHMTHNHVSRLNHCQKSRTTCIFKEVSVLHANTVDRLYFDFSKTLMIYSIIAAKFGDRGPQTWQF